MLFTIYSVPPLISTFPFSQCNRRQQDQICCSSTINYGRCTNASESEAFKSRARNRIEREIENARTQRKNRPTEKKQGTGNGEGVFWCEKSMKMLTIDEFPFQ